MKDNYKHGRITTRNLVELDFTKFTKRDYSILTIESTKPAKIFGDRKINEYRSASNCILLRSYSVDNEESYDNVYFADFVLTDCRILTAPNGKSRATYIFFEKITLV